MSRESLPVALVFYRYEDSFDEGDFPRLRRFSLTKQTECYREVREWGTYWPSTERFRYRWIKYRHEGIEYEPVRKMFAWPTKEEALASYIRRKEIQLSIYRYRVRQTMNNLKKAKAIQNRPAAPINTDISN